MRINFGAKPYLFPQPVLIVASYGEDGTPDAMNAAWGGISDNAELTLSLSAGHKTTANILSRRAFTVSMGDASVLAGCDYVGLVSANRVPDKLARAGFHPVRSEFVDAPLLEELPLALECRLVSYDTATERLVGEIVNVSAAESALGADGKIDPSRFAPLVYDPMNSAYRLVGEKAGDAFRDGLRLS